MKKKTKKILTVLLLIWFLMFAADIVTAFVIDRPIFCIEWFGGENTPYYGLGYKIHYFFGWPLPGEEFDPGPPHIYPWIYIAVNAVIIAALVLSRRKRKQASGK